MKFMGYIDSFFVDIAWLVCGLVTLYIGIRLKPKVGTIGKGKVRVPISINKGKVIHKIPVLKAKPSTN